MECCGCQYWDPDDVGVMGMCENESSCFYGDMTRYCGWCIEFESEPERSWHEYIIHTNDENDKG